MVLTREPSTTGPYRVAVVTAAMSWIVGVGLWVWALAQPGSTQPNAGQKVKVLVTRQKVPICTRMREPEHFFTEKEFAKGTVPENAFGGIDQVKDKFLARTLAADAPVTPDDLMQPEATCLCGDLPPGIRAVSVDALVAPDAAAAIRPLARVDVLWTGEGEDGVKTRVVLRGVVVLGVDPGPGVKQAQTTEVTLKVSLEDAERLSLAVSRGKVRLILADGGNQ